MNWVMHIFLKHTIFYTPLGLITAGHLLVLLHMLYCMTCCDKINTQSRSGIALLYIVLKQGSLL